MLFLLPPSETKQIGGKPLNIGQVALTFGQLNDARDQVYAALKSLCEGEADEAAKVLPMPLNFSLVKLHLIKCKRWVIEVKISTSLNLIAAGSG